MYSAGEAALSDQIRNDLASVVARIGQASPQVAVAEQIDAFLNMFAALPQGAGYKFIPDSAAALLAALKQDVDDATMRLFLYACVLAAAAKTLGSARFSALPARVRDHQTKQLRRIVSNQESIVPICALDRDLFHKEFGLATLRLYAGAAQLIDYRAGVGRALLWKGGLSDLPRRLGIFAAIGGFKPFFEIHTHDFYLDEFTPPGWDECYRCCAELYSVHPDVLGMYGGSWFYDPSLSVISPRLAYLRAVPQSTGAHVLFDSVNDQSTLLAVSTSPTRKALFDNGSYKPASYAMIWGRSAQLAWYEQDAQRAQSQNPECA